MFDLASKITGVCLWDLVAERPIETTILKVPDNTELGVAALYEQIAALFTKLNAREDVSKLLVCKEAMPTQLHGGASTVQTFIALARSHAILDLYTQQHGLAMYDYVGVYPISTHAYLRRLLNLEAGQKIDKKDIQAFVAREYDLPALSFDEADAVFLAKTFVDVKWDKDLTERVREIGRHIKTLKDPHRIAALKHEQEMLNALKIH